MHKSQVLNVVFKELANVNASQLSTLFEKWHQGKVPDTGKR